MSHGRKEKNARVYKSGAPYQKLRIGMVIVKALTAPVNSINDLLVFVKI